MENKDGWQVWVKYRKDKVIKTPKNAREIRKRIKKNFQKEGKMNKIDKAVRKLIEDREKSTEIILKTKMPMKYFAYPEFLDGGIIRQAKVISLNERLKELIKKGKNEEAKKIIRDFFKFIHKMWAYGLHEKPIKFNLNFGLMKNDVILIDLFELTNHKNRVKKTLVKRSWRNAWVYLRKELPKWLVEYYIKEADKNLTIKNLNKYWKRKI